MRKTVIIAALSATLICATALAQVAPLDPEQELAIMRAAQGTAERTEQWTFWMMVTGVGSAVFAFLGFVGVMLTLREQRMLTHAQERAFLEFASLGFDPTNIRVTGRVQNLGRTRATNVRLTVHCDMFSTVKGEKDKKPFGICHDVIGLGNIAAQTEATVKWQQGTILYPSTKYPDRVVDPKARIDLKVELTYVDVFSRRHRVNYKFGLGWDLHEAPASDELIELVRRGVSINQIEWQD